MFDKRKYPRVELSITVVCRNYLEKKRIEANAKNISEGGMCLDAGEALPPYGHVELEFQLPDGSEIRAIGEVKWSLQLSETRFVAGLSFTDVKKTDLEKIRQFVDGERKSACAGRERRGSKRVLLGVIVDFISSEAEAKNLSDRGMCITSSEKYEIGKIADLMFFLPVSVGVKAMGRVIWTKKIGHDLYDYGIEFIDIDKKNIDIIRKYIEENE